MVAGVSEEGIRMNPEKALSRLTARVGSLDTNVRATDNSSVTSSDVAYALAGLADFHANLILYKYAQGDDLLLARLSVDWQERVRIICAQEGGGKHRKIPDNRLVLLANATLEEFIGNRLCTKCNGIGCIKKGERFEVCKTCEGARVQNWSHARRARSCGMDYHNFRKLWKPRYRSCLGRLINIEQNALSKVKRKLG